MCSSATLIIPRPPATSAHRHLGGDSGGAASRSARACDVEAGHQRPPAYCQNSQSHRMTKGTDHGATRHHCRLAKMSTLGGACPMPLTKPPTTTARTMAGIRCHKRFTESYDLFAKFVAKRFGVTLRHWATPPTCCRSLLFSGGDVKPADRPQGKLSSVTWPCPEMTGNFALQEPGDFLDSCLPRKKTQQFVHETIVFVARRSGREQARRIPAVDQRHELLSPAASTLALCWVHGKSRCPAFQRRGASACRSRDTRILR